MEKFVFLCSRIRPVWIKKKWFSFFHILFSLFTRVLTIVSQIRLPVFLLNAVDKASNEPVHALYIGKNNHPHFIFHKLFDEDPVMEKKGKVWIWNWSKSIRKYNSEVSGVSVSCDRFLHRFLHEDGWLVIPHWIRMWFDSSKDLSVLLDELSRSASHDVNKVKRQGFSFKITSDIEKIRFFYEKMYLPTISKNIDKDEAYLADYLFFLLRYYRGYELMMINHDGKAIAGVFFIQENDTMMLEYAGVYQADASLIKQGAFSAIYYFAIELAKQRKVKKIDFGGVRPFHTNGLFQYKKKWGMKMNHYDIVTDVTGFTIVGDSDDFKQFLIDNPFIGMDKKGRLVWYVFSRKNLNDARKKEFKKELKIPGVEKVCFVEL